MDRRKRHKQKKAKQRIIEERGYVCQYIGCTWQYNLEMHHIDKNPNNNDDENCLLLCPNHHSYVHNKSTG